MRDTTPVVAEKSAPPSPEVIVELKQQQRLFAELVGATRTAGRRPAENVLAETAQRARGDFDGVAADVSPLQLTNNRACSRRLLRNNNLWTKNRKASGKNRGPAGADFCSGSSCCFVIFHLRACGCFRPTCHLLGFSQLRFALGWSYSDCLYPLALLLAKFQTVSF